MISFQKRTTRGNALTKDLRLHLIDFMCYQDDWSQTNWNEEEKKVQSERLNGLNNTHFREAFIERYGKEWWDDMLNRH
jgi:hypothetical protein